ncbi:oligosaccharide flippase family protein [Klenkia sp. PcliD-1-E]|uniref:oligosaccharide flippase family protein n=1 Tax=Klenkia sp. PcliD-1-E TaxID=2954492 RepID=UPI0020978E66|nr:oligosaccharide flippase family protein [Klenkia sp. PcliD-1-E]MCO7221847.1 oligosaccharide flippase family protein [Klenkia sp. PcliD-1-E]
MPPSRSAPAARRDRPPLLRVVQFYGLTAATAVAPLVALPAITSSAGAAGFAAVVLGQTLGAAAAVVVLMGWGLVGAHVVAVRQGSPEQLQEVYWTSLFTRLAVSAVVLPVVALVAFLVAPDEPAVVALMAVGSSLVGLTSSWYFVGLGRSGLVAVYETLPQVGVSVLGSIALWLGMPLVGFPLLTIAANLLAVLLAFLRLRGDRATRRVPGIRATITSLREQAPLIVSSLATYAWTGFAVTLVAAVAPASLPLFAALYRVQLLGRALLFPFKNALQSWVSGSRGAERAGRTRTAVLATGAAGLLAAVSMTILTPVLDGLIFSGTIEVGVGEAAAMASSLVVVSLSLGYSAYVLIPAGLTRVVVASTVTGAVVGAPLLLLGARAGGAVGASLAILVTETVVLATALGVRSVVGRRARRTAAPLPDRPSPVPAGDARD